MKRIGKDGKESGPKRVIFEDLVSLENVRNVSQVELLASLLPERVGSLLSINNLSTDLQVAFETAEKWISMLENLYVCFRISPWTNSKVRSLKKERKVYMWDWSVCLDESARYENMVASHLLKFCNLWEDSKRRGNGPAVLEETPKVRKLILL